MDKEEILKVIDKGLESLLKEPNEIQQAFSNGCRYTMNVFQYFLNYCEKLEKENQELKDRISEVKWKPIEEYQQPKYDWVLVKYYIEPEFECIPCVAEKRFGKWYDRNDILINGEVRYFFDMQLLDILDKGDEISE